LVEERHAEGSGTRLQHSIHIVQLDVLGFVMLGDMGLLRAGKPCKGLLLLGKLLARRH
jgi:hypothetical protein